MKSAAGEDRKGLTVMGAAFLGIGAMVGAGIFALLGQAGGVAGSAVWVSFLLGGVVATLLGYTVAKLGARYPSSGGMIAFLVEGFGNGHRTGIAAWLMYFSGLIVTAMVASAFGSYAASIFASEPPQVSIRLLAMGLILAMGADNIIGTEIVNRVQSIIVFVLLAAFLGFIVATWTQIDADLLRPSTYPSIRDIITAVGFTFFAYLGFSVVSFAGADLDNPQRSVPRATYIALALTILVYVAIAIGVFGTLTPAEVIAHGDTALAEAARPALGEAGFAIMALAALLATSSSANANLYAAKNVTSTLARMKQFPPFMAKESPFKTSWGLVVSIIFAAVLAGFFDLTAIASVGSLVALAMFLLVGVTAIGLRRETDSRLWVILLAIVTDMAVLVLFLADSFQNNKQAFSTAIVLALVAVLMDVLMTPVRSRTSSSQTGGPLAGSPVVDAKIASGKDSDDR